MVYDKLTDLELIEACRNDNVKAFNVLFGRYSGRLYSYAIKYVNDASIAEETMLDIMMWVWEKSRKGEVKIRGDFSSYIFTATKHAVIKAVIKKNQYEHVHAPEEQSGMISVPAHDEDIHCRELEAIFKQKLPLLSPQRRLIFIMSRYENLTHDQIARKLGLSVFTVKNHIKASLKYFREQLKV